MTKKSKKTGTKVERKVVKKTTKKKSVRIGSSNVKERQSRNNFELIMGAWVCIPTNGTTDHGYDYTVEIVSEDGIQNFKPDGKFFLVQLKSQSKLSVDETFVTPHPIETRKIRQWYQSSSQMPFLFVVNDIAKKKFYYQWIDDGFISNLEREQPYWNKADKITIKIPINNLLVSGQHDGIREYVYNYRQAYKKLLEPGVFFEMKDKIRDSILRYEELISVSPFESVKGDVKKLKEGLENAVYRIAITGLSRVGKSSLINALLKRPDISPTDVWQTTGVPIIIHPGREERVQINFYDRNKPAIQAPYSSELIKEYAARENNEDNYKRVSEVNVFISSAQLERGVMFYDIPGLNDPNDEILDFAFHTADCANAILYLIDGALADSGSFIFSNEIKKHIEKFSQKDKVFLIVNKVDKLSPSLLRDLKNEIERNLKKYNLKEKVAEKIYFLSISPKNQENLASLKSEITTIEELEKDLWAFMLNENKVGFYKLYVLMKDLQLSIKQLESIIRARALESKDKKKLNEAIAEVRTKVPGLERHVHSQLRSIQSRVATNLELRKQKAIENIHAQLEQIPLDKELPSDDALKSFLIQRGYQIVSSTQEDLNVELNKLKEYIDEWIETNLKQVREIIDLGVNNPDYKAEEINQIQMPSIDFSSTWGRGILGAFVGTLLGPLGWLGMGLGSIFLDLIFGQESRRTKRIRKTMEKINDAYEKSFADVKFNFNNLAQEQINVLIEYVNRKLKLYFDDIESQISKYVLHPSFDYVAFEKQTQSSIPEINAKIINVWEDVQSYVTAIKPL
ncbi:MAG: dynamin family protein [Bacteroidia bacterium]|nr:dynamin family protein [Bacteroidia bacterium]